MRYQKIGIFVIFAIFTVALILTSPAIAEERTGVVVNKESVLSIQPELTTNLTYLVGALLTNQQAINLCLSGNAPINASLMTTNSLQAEEYGGLGSPIPSGTMQGFPTATTRFVALSSGDAQQAAGTFTTFNSFLYGGSQDSATLQFDCNACPTGRGKVSVDWTYCTEENPTWLGSIYQDPASVSIIGSVGGAAFDSLTVDTAAPLSNAVTGTSPAPLPPSPTPDDVVYNSCLLPINSPRTVTANVLGAATITLSQADAGDNTLDTTSFFDNVVIECRLEIDLKPGSNPNCTDLMHGGGNVSVAILGSAVFDSSTINESTILFDGAEPRKCSTEDVDLDGYMDLVCKFRKSEMVSWENPPANCQLVDLTAQLLDGTPVAGSDVLCTPGGENCEYGTPTTAPF
jgi:hypothetical protein